METVNIIGAGLSGLSAAITLAEKGIKSNLISVQPSERAQSVLAEGGINAALDTMGENDSPEEHFEETMKGGVWLEDEKTVKNLTYGAVEVVKTLEKWGVPFNYENGKLCLRNFGGQKKKRTAFTQSTTGKSLMTALIDEARRYEAKGLITRYAHHSLIKLEIADGKCSGTLIRDVFTGEIFRFGGKVLLCIGGMSGMFYSLTTGTTQNSGSIQALAFMDGVDLYNLEFIQYHPTTVEITGKRMLISEAARGEGGRLFTYKNGNKFYFMEEKYPELKNLMPRDVVSRECFFAMRDPETDGKVYLDLTGISKETWKNKLADLREEIISYRYVDPANVPVEVSPGIHFFMGGFAVNENHETNVLGLYAAGECASIYHGANRLGGNSLLGAVFGGKKAAQTIAASLDECEPNIEKIADSKAGFSVWIDYCSPEHARRLTNILYDGLGIVRDEQTLKKALVEVDKLIESSVTEEEIARATLGKAMILSALSRKESRGAHYRSDYPEKSENFRKKTVAKYRDGKIIIDYKSVEGSVK